MAEADGPRIAPAELDVLVVEAIAGAGAPIVEARALSDSLLDASLRGVDSHGVNLLPDYLPRIAAGGWVMPSPARIVHRHGGVAIIDGGSGLGVITATLAITQAVEIARTTGIGAVSVRNGSHFGAAGYYARMPLGAGMIGLVFTNASPGVAPHGGIQPLLSNNPWAIAVPSNEEFDVVLDIANSVVARSWIRLAAQAAKAIPVGWAIDTEGNSTTDADAALAGALLPIAGHKGYGITFMVDVLAGILAGAAFGPDVGSPFPIQIRAAAQGPGITPAESAADRYSPQRVGHLFVALDVASFRPLREFKADVSALIARLHASLPAPGVDRVRVPGEPEHERWHERRTGGVPVSPAVLAALRISPPNQVETQAWQIHHD